MEQYLLPRSFEETRIRQKALTPESYRPRRTVLITGITGQDGLYLTSFLATHPDYEYLIHGIVRKNSASLPILLRLKALYPKTLVQVHFGDLTDAYFITKLITSLRPDEIYNLAA
jgi:GDPmannose 4,6-dehydratase